MFQTRKSIHKHSHNDQQLMIVDVPQCSVAYTPPTAWNASERNRCWLTIRWQTHVLLNMAKGVSSFKIPWLLLYLALVCAAGEWHAILHSAIDCSVRRLCSTLDSCIFSSFLLAVKISLKLVFQQCETIFRCGSLCNIRYLHVYSWKSVCSKLNAGFSALNTNAQLLFFEISL